MNSDTVIPSLAIPLRGIDEVEPLSKNDTACITEVRDVLKKHGCLDRFGISLLHQHLPVGADEVLVETCDLQKRELTLKPIKKSELVGQPVIETNWRLGPTVVVAMCINVCISLPTTGRHIQRHTLRD